MVNKLITPVIPEGFFTPSIYFCVTIWRRRGYRSDMTLKTNANGAGINRAVCISGKCKGRLIAYR